MENPKQINIRPVEQSQMPKMSEQRERERGWERNGEKTLSTELVCLVYGIEMENRIVAGRNALGTQSERGRESERDPKAQRQKPNKLVCLANK